MRSTAAPTSPARRPRSFGSPALRTDGDLLALAFVDDALWSVEEPGILRRWDVRSREQQSWESLDELATFWTFHPSGGLLAASSDEVGVWDVASGEQLIGWSVPSWCTAVAFQPTGPLVATGHDDGSIHYWDRTTGREIGQLSRGGKPISALCFSADGQRLASASEDRTVSLWTAPDGTPIGTLAGHTDRIPALAWHPDGKRLYSAGWDTSVWVWDTTRLAPIILLNSHAAQVYTLTLSRDGRMLASADSANAVHLWDTETNREVKVLREKGGGEIRALAFNATGNRLAWGGADRLVHLWDASQATVEEAPTAAGASRTGVAVSPEGHKLCSLGTGTDLRIWDVNTGRRAGQLDGSPTLRAFAASPDGQWLAGSRRDADNPRATLALWSAATGARQAILDGQAGPITTLAFSPDSTLLASAGTQNSDVWLWQIPSGQPLVILPDTVGSHSLEGLAIDSRGQYLAVAGVDWLEGSGPRGLVTVWDLPSRQQRLTISGGATAVAFQPGSHLLAVAGLNHAVRVFDAATGQLIQEVPGHLETVTSLAFSPDGRWLASGSDDRTVRLWEMATIEPAGAVELDTQVKALAFSPDGQFLYTGNANTGCYQLPVQDLLHAEL